MMTRAWISALHAHTSETTLMRDLRTAVRRVHAVIALTLLIPAMARAQAAAAIRSSDGAPSTNAETRRMSDSLTVYFIRTPKGKPAARSAAGTASGATSQKFAGRPDVQARHVTPSTPLPERARTAKQ